jgi:hypothetical protein
MVAAALHIRFAGHYSSLPKIEHLWKKKDVPVKSGSLLLQIMLKSINPISGKYT